MHSELRVTASALDLSLIAKHLQLKGEVDPEGWRFPAAPSASAKGIGQQLDYWRTLLTKKKEGRLALSRLGYSFAIRIFTPRDSRIAILPDKIDALARQGLGLEVICEARFDR